MASLLRCFTNSRKKSAKIICWQTSCGLAKFTKQNFWHRLSARRKKQRPMEVWARAFDSWDVVDTACCYLYAGTKFAWKKAQDWSKRRELFIKRAGFSLVAYLSYKDKQSPDERFAKFLKVVERESDDDRHFVKKAVNWALRNIGKRNLKLNREAIRVAEKLRKRDSRAARWIAADALRELRSEAVQRRLRQKSLYRR
jgi:3-methyladenine DNA glycosylase AlkD